MDINFELYKVFYYVASSLSFSEASKKLFISQSAVSQSIKTLERKLEQSLFIRSTKKVQLTPAGELLLKHIEPAVNLIQRGENQLLDSSTLGLGQLHIGASDTICRYFLVPYLKQFHTLFPTVPIKVTNAASLNCADLLSQGKVDLIVTNHPNSRINSAFIQKKTAKLEKYCDDINKVEVSLKVVKPETAMNKEASIKVLVPNGEFFAEKVSDTFEESVDVCVDALSKQLTKYKEKLRGK